MLRFVVARLAGRLRRPCSIWTSPRAAARHAAHEEALFAVHVEQALQIVRQLPAPYAVPAGRVGATSRSRRQGALARQ